MKKLIGIISFFVLASFAIAQTPQEIVSRMDEEMSKHEKEGLVMTVDTKIPVMGTMSARTYSLGSKTRMETTMLGQDVIIWSDGKTEWTYTRKNNEVKITNQKEESSESDGDAEMFDGITDGYDVYIDKETAKEWTILCKKSKSNSDNDAPKKMELVIAKGTYKPVSLKTKMSGITITMHNISFGVTERQVTFNPQDYPGVTIVDKR